MPKNYICNFSSLYPSELSMHFPTTDRQRKCTIFPFHPLDHKEERRLGVVLWVPSSIRELVDTAKEQLKFSGASCILSENGGKILDIGMICDGQKLFLVSDDSANLG